MPGPTNLFALEPVLLQALREVLPAGVRVGSGANLVGRTSLAGLCPAVLVTPMESAVSDGDDDPAPGEAVTTEDETWTVTALVAFTRDADGLTSNFQQAGELLGRAYDALHGLGVPGYRTLVYTGRQQPMPTVDGVCECSIDFNVIRAFAPAEP